MVSLALLLSVGPVVYGWGPDVKAAYDVKVSFDGYLPVLGGTQGKIVVDMNVAVAGLAAKEAGTLSASSEITEFALEMNGAKMPFTAGNVQAFFPKTTITFEPTGKTLTTDAPNIQLPVKLPGLDVKRFPDITYLPIEFPMEDLKVGQNFEFTKPFGESTAHYQATPTALDDEKVEMKVEFQQAYTSYEDETHNPVADAAHAESRIDTKVEGTGAATFDLRSKLIDRVTMTVRAHGDVSNLKSQKTSARDLTTVLDVKRKP